MRRDAAMARGGHRRGADRAEVERLAEEKLLIAGGDYKQIFQPYISSNVPTFVTSDSALAAFHALFEASVVRLELARAIDLPRVLLELWNGIPAAAGRFNFPAELLDDARLRAQVLIGTALRLVGAATPDASAQVTQLIDVEVERVVRATDRLRPTWLGAPDRGFPFLDYGAFRPRGFYESEPMLATYFRAVSWLQAVPLRFDHDAEILTAMLLGETIREDDPSRVKHRYRPFVDATTGLLGRYGDLPLPEIYRHAAPWSRTSLVVARAKFHATWREYSLEPIEPLHGVEPSFRVLPAANLPDSAMFDRAMRPSPVSRYPSGLFVAAVIGGSFARTEALRDRSPPEIEQITQAIDHTQAWLRTPTNKQVFGRRTSYVKAGNFYARTLSCLATLFEGPETGAPPLFRSNRWRVKNTNTVLASWAQLRHSFTLMAREARDTGGNAHADPGFVEPNPRFFRELAMLCEVGLGFFEEHGVFDPMVERHELAATLDAFAIHLRGDDCLALLDELPREKVLPFFIASLCIERLGGSSSLGGSERRSGAMIPADLALLEASAQALRAGGELSPSLAEFAQKAHVSLRSRWAHLERMSHQLEAMAQKQLRGAPWDSDERDLLFKYGYVLAEAMLNDGNGHSNPRDDAPRAVSVYAWLGGEPPGYLHAATARPRSLWILYPTPKGEVLCRGAIYPYREFVHEQRLTDSEWRAILDSADAPKTPTWLRAIECDSAR